MNQLLTTLAIGLLIIGCTPKKESAESKTSTTLYTCSMHPQIRQDHPGDCPICGMDLVPVSNSEKKESSSSAPELFLKHSSIGREKAEGREIHRSIPLFGEIHYILDRHTHKTWLYGGRIERLLISYNTTELQQGQAILELYSEEAIADQERYLSALKSRFLSTFYERKVASAEVEAAKSRLLQAGFTEADLKNLVDRREVKRLFIIRAPHAGTIIGHLPEIGSRITPDTTLFHIVPPDEVWFNAHVFEQDLGGVQNGQTAQVELKSFPGETFSGKVVFIDRMIDTGSCTAQVRIHLKNPEKKLLPEMSGSGKIQVESRRLPVTVHHAAIIDTGKRKIVYVETTPDHFEPRLVTTGLSDQNHVEIRSGVQPEETVVSNGAFLLDAEAQLRGVLPKPAPDQDNTQSEHLH